MQDFPDQVRSITPRAFGFHAQPHVGLGRDLSAEVFEVGGHASGHRLIAEVIRELLHRLNARVFCAANALPLLDGEVGDAGFLGDQPQGLVAFLQLAHDKFQQGFFHARNLAIYDYNSKPQMASHYWYGSRMRREPQQKAAEILADNIERLISIKGSQNALMSATGVKQRTISRIKNADNSARIKNLDDLASGFGLQQWQLLVPGLDPQNPPKLSISPPSNQQPPPDGPTTTQLARLPKRGSAIPARTPKVPQPKRG